MSVKGDSNRLVNVLKFISEEKGYTGKETFVIQLSQQLNNGIDILYVGTIKELLDGDNYDGMNLYEYRYLQKVSGWEDKEYYILTVDFNPENE